MSRQLTSGVLGRKISVVSQPEFIILVNTALAGSASDTIQLPIGGVDMTIDWGDGTIDTGVTQTATPESSNWITHIYSVGGIYQIKISGGLTQVYYRLEGDRLKIIDIQNWGVAVWETFLFAYFGCNNMFCTAKDTPNLTNVTNFRGAFNQARMFNPPNISNWDVSNITNMLDALRNTDDFNQDISNWDVSNVTNMNSMFRQASSFNQDLSGWCVEKIASRPNDFDLEANSWVYNTNGDTGDTDGVDPATIINRPIWGTCPQ